MRKITGVLICMLFFIPVLSIAVAADPEPELEIKIKGGISAVYTFVKNIGDEEAVDVVYDVSIKGGVLGKGDFSAQFALGDIAPDISRPAHLWNSYQGFPKLGKMEITITLDAENSEPITVKANGFVFFFVNIIY
jgi:hypothetical protein